jgi:hypothetical protein
MVSAQSTDAIKVVRGDTYTRSGNRMMIGTTQVRARMWPVRTKPPQPSPMESTSESRTWVPSATPST